MQVHEAGAKVEIDYEFLHRQGYVVLHSLLGRHVLNRIENVLDTFCATQYDKFGMAERDEDPLVALFNRDAVYRAALFPMLRNLHCFQRVSADIGNVLERSGLFRTLGYRVPAVWPYLRFDPPDEAVYLLPMHQDYKTTRCDNALRLWLPLRDVDEHAGSMRVAEGSHREGPLPHDTSVPRYPHVPADRYRDYPAVDLRLPAGDGVLFDPLVVHGSLINRSSRMKIVMLIQIQDLATLRDPDDRDDPAVAHFHDATTERMAAEMLVSQTGESTRDPDEC